MAGKRALARQAIKDWIDAANVRYLDQVFVAPPLRLDFPKYASDLTHQCQAVVFIETEGELRMSLGGESSGKKRIDYLASIEIYYRCLKPAPEEAQDVFDDLVDEIKDQIRSDRRLNQDESVIWQAGEGGYGMQLDFMDPADGNVGGEPIEHYARLRFEVTVWITA